MTITWEKNYKNSNLRLNGKEKQNTTIEAKLHRQKQAHYQKQTKETKCKHKRKKKNHKINLTIVFFGRVLIYKPSKINISSYVYIDILPIIFPNNQIPHL